MRNAILGISAYYHDSAAALLQNGEIIAAAQEERFSRKKHDASFPANAVRYVLDEAGLDIEQLDAIAFYDKPWLKFERLLETSHAFAPAGLQSFLAAMPVWVKEKLFMKRNLWKELGLIHGQSFGRKPPLLFPEHHLSHAASAFYPSPFHDASILTIDGVGEWATTTIGYGAGEELSLLKELSFPHSIGLLYSAFTYFLGFKVNSGEYKLMGLAPYGELQSARVNHYKQLICEKLVDLKDDGSLLLNMEYFDFATGLTMCRNSKWEELFSLKKRDAESAFQQEHMDMAQAIQQVIEEIILRLAGTARRLTESRNLVMAGGVALNCVVNGRLLKSKIFKHIWIQPAAGDAGGALGAAYAVRHIWQGHKRIVAAEVPDKMQGCYLGPSFSQQSVQRLCRKYQAPAHDWKKFDQLTRNVAALLAEGKIIGWFQGRMEWGPRALGNRSILGDPRNAGMQKKLNMQIKYREGFRPFAPSVLAEEAAGFFQLDCSSPYMLLVAPVAEGRRKKLPDNYLSLELYERLYCKRSDVPAITHVDFSARIQTVHKETNPRYWQLIADFKEITGYGLVVNTSFNVRGEPIVCTPEDAYRCFMRTGMDYLVINNYLFSKSEQPEWEENKQWQTEFTLD
ncbi:MAG: carbamoyltransferase [Proteobacteria bacterium]|nr:carbamoyltransferase [Pseudomonadota bacterium]MBU4296686.1 carbamoyltransferase [Pseudomonadota bacterium]MCG2748479.1 carbamoyltransferase [Desulfobulbaceae bacterium]